MRAEESARRLSALRRRLVDQQLDGFLVTASPNVRYLSGFSGSLGYLIIATDTADIVGDSRYWLQMEEEAPAFTLARVGPSGGLWGVVAERLHALHLKRVGFESQQVTVDQHRRLVAALPDDLTLTPTSGVVEDLRMTKTAEEIALLRTAARIASRAFDRVREAIRPGLRERDVAFLLEQTFRELGADGPAFETIVAAGERGALPHGRASDRVIRRGDMVVIDFGAQAGGYNSDATRTVVIGQPSAEQRRVIDAVAQAQAASLALMKVGTTADAVDRRARETLAGERHAFAHGLGHGIGLEVHERPYLSASDPTPLALGMVITNEPGIYVPGWGGVRLEDMVMITDGEPEVLTPASREIAIA